MEATRVGPEMEVAMMEATRAGVETMEVTMEDTRAGVLAVVAATAAGEMIRAGAGAPAAVVTTMAAKENGRKVCYSLLCYFIIPALSFIVY